MTLPTIHLNGTSRTALMDAQVEALTALQTAIDKAVEAGPNARDYYPQGPGAFDAAVAEHQARLDKLRAVAEELAVWLDGVFNAPGRN